jgi:hypothetical protein
MWPVTFELAVTLTRTLSFKSHHDFPPAFFRLWPLAARQFTEQQSQALEREGLSFTATQDGEIGVRLQKKPQRG